jgi:hypothetical protein
MPKRLVVISDLHCGHRAGLTPPDWQWPERSKTAERRRFAEVQRRVWEFYATTLASLAPIDCLVVNGDAIDGKGERSGGTELLEADRTEQVAMAACCIREAKARRIYVISGTPYHTGREDDYEADLAREVGAAHYGAHEWIDCEGVIFDVRHKVSSSVIPHGRNTGPNRAALWNSLWAERGIQPRAQVIVRSHVHYHVYSGDARRLVITTPALQAWTKYGSKECEGTNDIGLVNFDCDKGSYTWLAHLLQMEWAAVKPLRA